MHEKKKLRQKLELLSVCDSNWKRAKKLFSLEMIFFFLHRTWIINALIKLFFVKYAIKPYLAFFTSIPFFFLRERQECLIRILSNNDFMGSIAFYCVSILMAWNQWMLSWNVCKLWIQWMWTFPIFCSCYCCCFCIFILDESILFEELSTRFRFFLCLFFHLCNVNICLHFLIVLFWIKFLFFQCFCYNNWRIITKKNK